MDKIKKVSKKVKPRKDINRDGQSNRAAQLNAKAQAKGWTGISEYLTAVINDKSGIPEK